MNRVTERRATTAIMCALCELCGWREVETGQGIFVVLYTKSFSLLCEEQLTPDQSARPDLLGPSPLLQLAPHYVTDRSVTSAFTPYSWTGKGPRPGQNMRCCAGLRLLLLLCFGMLRVGAGLRCYKCSDYTGRCQNVQECTYEDSCISLSERGGKTIRQCIRYTDCDNSRLTQMFPAISGFTYRCCSSNLCNGSSAAAAAAAAPAAAALGSLLAVWWCLL
ncbi:uncharacterized protein LOC130114410 [Lampris incognitus]|uniref:uncharacterized protein LOC130114410 n=1 Tax=Lampris incognitus TaxID=2546036 RepID=UPI0024B497B6|nr:uncharacterized protein LOC130114410 [Lampris incognitus]